MPVLRRVARGARAIGARRIAGAELTLKTLLLDLPGYVRECRAILGAPSAYFGRLAGTGGATRRRGVAFMLQDIAVAFVILTIGWTCVACWVVARALRGVASGRHTGDVFAVGAYVVGFVARSRRRSASPGPSTPW